jgi:peroxiredoxin
MSLSDEVERLRHRLAGTIDPADERLLGEAGRLLDVLEHADGALGVGDTLPELTLRDTAGRRVASADLLARGPLVLSFFRHGWLAACAGFLAQLEAARPAVEALGGTVAGVAPHDVHHLAGTLGGRSFRFLLLGDPEGRVARLCGIVGDLPLLLAGRSHGHGWPWRACAGGRRCVLPLAATYVIGQDGVVVRAFLDARLACAVESGELLAAVRGLGAGRGAA